MITVSEGKGLELEINGYFNLLYWNYSGEVQ